jgi:hypothetical protein
VADDWCFCPTCRFPHSYKSFLEHLHAGGKCDMCGTAVQMSAVNKIDGKSYLLGGNASSRKDNSKDSKDGGPDDSKLTEEMQKKIREREGKQKKEEALKTEDL